MMPKAFRRPLLVTAVAFVAMLLYPPHVFDLGINGKFSAGYAFILDPPERNSMHALVNVPLLSVQLLAVGVIFFCVALMAMIKSETPKPAEIERAADIAFQAKTTTKSLLLGAFVVFVIGGAGWVIVTAAQRAELAQASPQLTKPVEGDAAVESIHPGWRKTVTTVEFRSWLKRMPVGVQDIAANSNDPKELVLLLDMYKSGSRQKDFNAAMPKR